VTFGKDCNGLSIVRVEGHTEFAKSQSFTAEITSHSRALASFAIVACAGKRWLQFLNEALQPTRWSIGQSEACGPFVAADRCVRVWFPFGKASKQTAQTMASQPSSPFSRTSVFFARTSYGGIPMAREAIDLLTQTIYSARSDSVGTCKF
jgi:hypothetical protein